MSTKVEFIQPNNFSLKGVLDNENDAVESLLEQSGYLCDAISSVADNHIPIYNGDIWENASDISDYIEQAISEGIAPVDGGNVDLMKIFQSGYYVFYQELLYENLDIVAFNYIADKVNEHLNVLEDISHLDVNEIEEAIEEVTQDTDNNDTFDDLDDKANEIIDRITEGDFGEVVEEEEDEEENI